MGPASLQFNTRRALFFYANNGVSLIYGVSSKNGNLIQRPFFEETPYIEETPLFAYKNNARRVLNCKLVGPLEVWRAGGLAGWRVAGGGTRQN